MAKRQRRKPKAGTGSNVEPLKDANVDDIREAVAALSKQDRAASRRKSAPELNQPEAAAAEASAAATAPHADEFREAERRAEAVLFASDQPISAETLGMALPPGADVAAVLMALKTRYETCGVQLVEVAGKWRFQTASDLAFLFEETREEERKLSRAALETLAVIAYRQPVTRAEIEDVRGVAASRGTLDVLMELDWVKIKGRRRTPGRPVVYGVTDAFLEHFGLESIDMLPGLDEMKAAGLLSSSIPDDFDMPRPLGSEAEDDLIEAIDPPEAANEDNAFVTDFMNEEDE